MKKKILVAGGAGFIGFHLCQKLLKKNYVICVDNLYTGSKKNVDFLNKNKNFQFIKKDIQKKFHLKCDEIYNLACPASPKFYQKNPLETIKTNILGSINLLDIANKNNAKIFQASTSEIYGDPLQHPQNEDYRGNVNTIGIRACYDEGKRLAESIFYDYYRTHNINIKIARLFNTYGPYMNRDDGRVVSNFIVQALKGEDITIYGDGDQTRSFCYVDDLINGITKFMNSASNINGPINLGNNSEFTMIELAEKVLKLTTSKSKLIFKPLPLDDPRQRQPDLTKAKEKLDWEPLVSLDDGLKETINYFKKIVG